MLERMMAAAVAAAAIGAAGAAPVDFVDPFIGTLKNGHCTPAACVPFGMVHPGPDTGNKTWNYTSGYRYEDGSILAFSQTHLNGTGGIPDNGDLRLMPFAGSVADAETNDFRSAFRKETETAHPGYYAVTLDGCGVRAEVASASRAAIYRFSYPEGRRARLLVDCQYGIGDVNLLSASAALDGRTGLSGTNRRRGWVEREISFAVEFDRPFAAVEELPKRSPDEKAPRYAFDFDLDGAPLVVKVGMSAFGGADGAKRNLAAEIPGWDFDSVRDAATAAWNDVLGRAEAEGSVPEKTAFYTSLYHLFMQPCDIADADERPFYSTLSLWDTFRAAHPLYTILTPERVPGMVDSMLVQGRRTGFLPVWTLWGRDNQCMIGTHSVPVIVDWFLKSGGSRSCATAAAIAIDWNAAYAQIKETLTKPHANREKENWDLCDRHGYYPFDVIRGEGVSRTMECAYDDWCAGVMADRLGHADDAAFFFRRAGNWTNVLDRSLGLVRGRDTQGRWREPFDPYQVGHGAENDNDFTEGNAFQYTWHVLHDPEGLVAALGGKEEFARRLDGVFTQSPMVRGSGLGHMSGMIGQYVHGNEPSHHVPYFFQFAGRPDRTAEIVREVCDRFYFPKPDGLCGNDDCGQMSAWYVFAVLGFYPFNPCGGEYVVGAPQFPKVVLRLGGSRSCATATDAQERVPPVTFTVIAKNLSRENKYVKSVTLDGKPLDGFVLRHADIMRGGELVFEMAPRP